MDGIQLSGPIGISSDKCSHEMNPELSATLVKTREDMILSTQELVDSRVNMFPEPNPSLPMNIPVDKTNKEEYTGGTVSYYTVLVTNPTTPNNTSYTAECNDIIESLGMNYAEGNAFKAIWRMCAARNGKKKKFYRSSLYDAEKVVFFGERLVAQAKAEDAKVPSLTEQFEVAVRGTVIPT